MSESMFGRLFTYAGPTKVRALENFTTEALAAMIRTDARPFMTSLERRGLLPLPGPHVQVVPETQVVVPGVGIIDLIARVITRSSLVAEAWVEVKVWAPESGDQLARYQRHLATLDDGVPRILLTIGPKPVGENSALPWVSWQDIRDEVERLSDANPLWREFSAFLEEQNVADVSSDALTAREAVSMTDAHAFFVKGTKVLSEVNASGALRWPAWGWTKKEQMTQAILGQFQRHARFTFATTVPPVYLVIGFTDLLNTGEAHLTVWVETNPRQTDLRLSLLKTADDGRLDGSWIRRLDSWQGLGKTQRAAAFDGPEAMVGWFEERLEELAAAAIGPAVAPIA